MRESRGNKLIHTSATHQLHPTTIEFGLLPARARQRHGERRPETFAFLGFLARMEFVGLGADMAKRPALLRYWRAMHARPSFAAAEVWTKPHPARMISAILGFGRR